MDLVSNVIIFFIVGDHLVILGGGYDRNALSDVEALEMQTDDTGCNPTDLPSPVAGHASVYSSSLKSLITCGGVGKHGDFQYLNSISSSSCSVQSNNEHQIEMPSMNSARWSFAMVSIGNQLISIGGDGTENTMETITLNATGTWHQESMPFSVQLHCAVVLGNNIIVIGGYDANNNVS